MRDPRIKVLAGSVGNVASLRGRVRGEHDLLGSVGGRQLLKAG